LTRLCLLLLVWCAGAGADAVEQTHKILAQIHKSGKPEKFRKMLGKTARVAELREAPKLGRGAVVGKLHKTGRKILVIRLLLRKKRYDQATLLWRLTR